METQLNEKEFQIYKIDKGYHLNCQSTTSWYGSHLKLNLIVYWYR